MSQSSLTPGTFPYIEGEDYRVAESGCWLWLRRQTRNGYALESRVAYRKASGTQYAHRAGWCVLRGVTLTNLGGEVHLHHRCRTPLCVNPDHLELVDRLTHLRRHGRDESHLTEQDIVDMRDDAWRHVTLTDLAAKYGLTITTVGLICKGKKWKDVGGPVGTPPKQCVICGADITFGNRKRVVCSQRCQTRRNYLAFTAGRKRHPAVEARWSASSSAPSTETTPLAPRGAQPPHQVHTTPSGGASGVAPDSLMEDAA